MDSDSDTYHTACLFPGRTPIHSPWMECRPNFQLGTVVVGRVDRPVYALPCGGEGARAMRQQTQRPHVEGYPSRIA